MFLNWGTFPSFPFQVEAAFEDLKISTSCKSYLMKNFLWDQEQNLDFLSMQGALKSTEHQQLPLKSRKAVGDQNCVWCAGNVGVGFFFKCLSNSETHWAFSINRADTSVSHLCNFEVPASNVEWRYHLGHMNSSISKKPTTPTVAPTGAKPLCSLHLWGSRSKSNPYIKTLFSCVCVLACIWTIFSKT